MISVVVATFNDRANLLRCLESLRAQTLPADQREVIVVDDGSTDATAEEVSARFPEIRLVLQDNAGPDAARNEGVGVSKGELVAFIDSDCTAPPEWLETLVRSLVSNQLSVVGGRILHRGPFLARVIGISDFGEFLSDVPKMVMTIPTCNMGIRRELLLRHPFEPRWKMLGDVLFSSALSQAGEKLVYDPSVLVYHHPRSGFSDFMKRCWRYGEGFVRTRRAVPTLSHSRWVRAGVPGVLSISLGRVLLDLKRLLLFYRPAGFRAFDLPAVAAVLLVKRILGACGAMKAFLTRGS